MTLFCPYFRTYLFVSRTSTTTIPAISNVLDSLQGRKYLAIEEGPMAVSGKNYLESALSVQPPYLPSWIHPGGSNRKIGCGNIVAWVFRARPVEQTKDKRGKPKPAQFNTANIVILLFSRSGFCENRLVSSSKPPVPLTLY